MLGGKEPMCKGFQPRSKSLWKTGHGFAILAGLVWSRRSEWLALGHFPESSSPPASDRKPRAEALCVRIFRMRILPALRTTER